MDSSTGMVTERKQVGQHAFASGSLRPAAKMFLAQLLQAKPCRHSMIQFRFPASRRAYAQAPRNEAKPKPKESTPLRRSAAQSLLIRANPTPTRGSIQTVFTLATADRYAMSRFKSTLPVTSQMFHDSWWIPKWENDGREGEVFIFSNGCAVGWGLEEADMEIFVRDVIKSAAGAELGVLQETETEELEFVIDSNE